MYHGKQKKKKTKGQKGKGQKKKRLKKTWQSQIVIFWFRFCYIPEKTSLASYTTFPLLTS